MSQKRFGSKLREQARSLKVNADEYEAMSPEQQRAAAHAYGAEVKSSRWFKVLLFFS